MYKNNTDWSVLFYSMFTLTPALSLQGEGEEKIMQARSEETRQHILEAALRRFANHGYNAASVDEICTDAGVSKGAFYHHFPSKQAVFIALLEGWLASVDASLKAARQPTVPATLIGMAERLPEILIAADGNLPMFLEFW